MTGWMRVDRTTAVALLLLTCVRFPVVAQETPVDAYLEITPFDRMITRIDDLNAMMERERVDVVIGQELSSIRGFGAFNTNLAVYGHTPGVRESSFVSAGFIGDAGLVYTADEPTFTGFGVVGLLGADSPRWRWRVGYLGAGYLRVGYSFLTADAVFSVAGVHYADLQLRAIETLIGKFIPRLSGSDGFSALEAGLSWLDFAPLWFLEIDLVNSWTIGDAGQFLLTPAQLDLNAQITIHESASRAAHVFLTAALNRYASTNYWGGSLGYRARSGDVVFEYSAHYNDEQTWRSLPVANELVFTTSLSYRLSTREQP